MWGNNYLIKFYSTPPKESIQSNKKLIHTALFSPAPRCYLDSPDLASPQAQPADTTILSFFHSLHTSTSHHPRLSVSAHLLLCFFLSSCLLSPSSTSVQPPLSLLSHGGRRTRARATQVSGEQFGVQFSVSNSRLAAHLD